MNRLNNIVDRAKAAPARAVVVRDIHAERAAAEQREADRLGRDFFEGRGNFA